MNFSHFCKPFYSKDKKQSGLRGYSSQSKIVQFFLSETLNHAIIEIDSYTDDLYRKWFTGEREINGDIWYKIDNVINESLYVDRIRSTVNESQILRMFSEYGVDTDCNDADKFCHAVTKQFIALIKGNGQAKNIIATMYQNAQPAKLTLNLDTDYFHLVVTLAEIFDIKYVDISLDRSLTYIATPEKFREGFKNRDKEFITSLYQYPAVICQENTGYNGITDTSQTCILARIKRIKISVKVVRIYFEPIATFSQALMNENSVEFDLDNTQTLTTLNTSHWSIRETNLKEAFEETEIPLTPQ